MTPFFENNKDVSSVMAQSGCRPVALLDLAVRIQHYSPHAMEYCNPFEAVVVMVSAAMLETRQLLQQFAEIEVTYHDGVPDDWLISGVNETHLEIFVVYQNFDNMPSLPFWYWYVSWQNR